MSEPFPYGKLLAAMIERYRAQSKALAVLEARVADLERKVVDLQSAHMEIIP